MVDLHVHFPMRLLGGVETPRDVLRGMTRVAARNDGQLRAAVLAIGPDHVAIGSDLDGFIKRTIGGAESAADLKPFADALRARHPEPADRILRDNPLRIIERRFAAP